MTASIAFAHALGLEVTAEGIETRIQLDRLAELGCDRGQGYLIGRPIRFEQVADMLQTEHLHIRPVKPVIRPVLLTDGTARAGGSSSRPSRRRSLRARAAPWAKPSRIGQHRGHMAGWLSIEP